MRIIPTYKLHDSTWVEFSYLPYNFDYGVTKEEISKSSSVLKCKDKYRTPIGNLHANTKHIQAQTWIHRVLLQKASIRLWGIRR